MPDPIGKSRNIKEMPQMTPSGEYPGLPGNPDKKKLLRGRRLC
jgi:hypothetical protein